MITTEEKAKAYDEALERAKTLYENANGMILKKWVEQVFPELAESEDERVRKWLITQLELKSDVNNPHDLELMILKSIAWLERQGSEPNWCHHKVDLSNCSEEYRKAYYDGYNKCNRDWIHSQEEQKASYTTIVETGDGGINALATRELLTNSCD